MQRKLNPWDIGPTELIKFALERMHGGSDFDKRLSFLVLDIGVETLFKTFLIIPDTTSHAKTSFTKRRDIVAGSFHDLINGIHDAVPERVKSINLEHVQYYHDIRNTLYHQGYTVAAVRIDQLREYAILAVELLRELLGVDLSEDLAPPESAVAPSSDSVVDAVEVELASGRYRIERLKSNTIHAIYFDSGKPVKIVKPFLQEVIQEHSLPVNIEFDSGKEKNTRTIGREVLKALKPSAWHGLVAGQEVTRDKLISMLTGRILEGKADQKNWEIVNKIWSLKQDILIFQPVGKGIGNSPFNLNCWYTQSGDPIKPE